jgi:hypothetical protein
MTPKVHGIIRARWLAAEKPIKQSVVYCHSSDKAVDAAMTGFVRSGYKSGYIVKSAKKTKLLKAAKS